MSNVIEFLISPYFFTPIHYVMLVEVM